MVGNFDGVHAGHAALVQRARSLVGSTGRVIALVFDPHPLTVINPGAAPARLSTLAQRERWLRELGVDELSHLEPSPELLAKKPDEFIIEIVKQYQPSVIVEGADFRFGASRAGGVETLRTLGEALGFEVELVEAAEVTLLSQHVLRASSTLLRWLIAQGRMGDAAITMARPYELTGTVAQGDQRGREIGCPTANIDTPNMLPKDGVYAGVAELADSRKFPAAISVGTKPTFGAHRRLLEAHLLDWAGPLAENSDEYGWPIKVSITRWLRDQVRYVSIEDLVEQIERDIQHTKQVCASFDPNSPSHACAEVSA